MTGFQEAALVLESGRLLSATPSALPVINLSHSGMRGGHVKFQSLVRALPLSVISGFVFYRLLPSGDPLLILCLSLFVAVAAGYLLKDLWNSHHGIKPLLYHSIVLY
jgi:hypothetical protein